MLKKLCLYDDQVFAYQKDDLYRIIFEFLCCYELCMIRKFHAKHLLHLLSHNDNIKNIELAEIKRKLDVVRLKFDEEIIFNSDGSPKKLYQDINKSNKSNHCIEKLEKLVSDLYMDRRELDAIQRENFNNVILIFTSILTVILSFTGIKEIVFNVILFIPLVNKITIITQHPLRLTILLWIVLIITIFLLIRKKNSTTNSLSRH